MRRNKKMFDSKILIAVISICLAGCFAIGGTVAWLVTETTPVVNTFTYGDINITLTETDTGDGDGNENTNEYIMVPGNKITKDPLVTVQAGSEACWLFVELDKSANFDTFMEYAVADGWTLLDGETGVYYRTFEKNQDGIAESFAIIKDNTVTVKGESVTKEMLNSLTDATFPKLTVTAYAVQKDNITTVAEAWALADTTA